MINNVHEIHTRNVYAGVAELADALVLGTSTNGVEVQVLSPAPTTFLFELIEQNWYKINQKWLIFSFAKNHLNSKKKGRML